MERSKAGEVDAGEGARERAKPSGGSRQQQSQRPARSPPRGTRRRPAPCALHARARPAPLLPRAGASSRVSCVADRTLALSSAAILQKTMAWSLGWGGTRDQLDHLSLCPRAPTPVPFPLSPLSVMSEVPRIVPAPGPRAGGRGGAPPSAGGAPHCAKEVAGHGPASRAGRRATGAKGGAGRRRAAAMRIGDETKRDETRSAGTHGDAGELPFRSSQAQALRDLGHGASLRACLARGHPRCSPSRRRRP